MRDTIFNFGKSVIQHGKYNDRVYLMKFSRNDYPHIIAELNRIAKDNGYAKIFAKVPQYAKESFIENGFIIEASVPSFYNGSPAFFMGKFFNEQRQQDKRSDETNQILEKAQQKAAVKNVTKPGKEFTFRICNLADAREIAEVYRRVFKTYPFPIHDHGFIMETMNINVIYFGMWYESKIVALSSAEIDIESGNAEMTDFATLPEYTGKGLAAFLLQQMELEIGQKQIKTTYSIARALSPGMNITFAKMGYIYSGTLINNTNISGSFESMNVWYKLLQ